MNIQQALNIFGLSGELTEQDVKRAYKQAAIKFHPDKNRENPAAGEMMKAVNAAYDFLMENIDRLNTAQRGSAPISSISSTLNIKIIIYHVVIEFIRVQSLLHRSADQRLPEGYPDL